MIVMFYILIVVSNYTSAHLSKLKMSPFYCKVYVYKIDFKVYTHTPYQKSVCVPKVISNIMN